MASHTASQRYPSTRGGSYDVKLAFEVFSLYILPSEIPSADLKDLIKRSYSTFRDPGVAPIVTLDKEKNIHLLELFHGPTFAFKDESGKTGRDREHLTVIRATSGDTGSAAIYASPVQEAQMTTVMDANVHNLVVDGTFDDCQSLITSQDFVKALFADPKINKTHRLAAINSINFSRILAQITYYFTHPLTLLCLRRHNLLRRAHRQFGEREVQEEALHGADAAGGLPEDGAQAHGDGVKETLSPAMDILVSSNFERLLWYLAYSVCNTPSTPTPERRATAGTHVRSRLSAIKTDGGFAVDEAIVAAARADFESECVSDEETLSTTSAVYNAPSPAMAQTAAAGTTGAGYTLDPHSAVGITAALRSAARNPVPRTHHVSLATAHPAKFSRAVEMALQGAYGFSFDAVLPEEFRGLEDKPGRVTVAKKGEGWEGVRRIVVAEVEAERAAAENKGMT
ncbi:tryptophan synthase beta subunit-like PLP-dependent enzyme [Cenococcum geophilum 1.58]|uniref:tryptophan synthase beta subunit-like PLP-dependent enzyme n=1 Tax=Cenococcum geophilum 1.58 TaxID=794803 RepID=UPI00358E0F53|nr:tryptophan synthase beta subunit-like PLP-dependent enzyme [Cenococcum geophilum 1.58]